MTSKTIWTLQTWTVANKRRGTSHIKTRAGVLGKDLQHYNNEKIAKLTLKMKGRNDDLIYIQHQLPGFREARWSHIKDL